MIEKEKTMKDGTMGYLSKSKRYYIRQEPYPKWKKIRYYTLDGELIKLAKATCPNCDEVIESKSCGDFVMCECGKSFVDTDRWYPERHRYGGEILK